MRPIRVLWIPRRAENERLRPLGLSYDALAHAVVVDAQRPAPLRLGLLLADGKLEPPALVRDVSMGERARLADTQPGHALEQRHVCDLALKRRADALGVAPAPRALALGVVFEQVGDNALALLERGRLTALRLPRGDDVAPEPWVEPGPRERVPLDDVVADQLRHDVLRDNFKRLLGGRGTVGGLDAVERRAQARQHVRHQA